jgi:hypothetical protein
MLTVAAAAGYASYLHLKKLPAVGDSNGGTTAARWWRGECRKGSIFYGFRVWVKNAARRHDLNVACICVACLA